MIAAEPVPDFPAGLALSKNGEWLAISGDDGNAVVLLDADTYERLGMVEGLHDPHGVAISAESNLLVVAERSGPTTGLGLPGLQERFEAGFRGVMILSDTHEDGFYVTGRIEHLVRISPEGEETARFQGDPIGMALSIDGDFLFVASEFPDNRIFTLRTPELDIVDDQPLPLRSGEGAIVPLKSGQIKIFGSSAPGSPPLLSVLYDPKTGEVGSLDTIVSSQLGLTFGGGAPWSGIGSGLVVVPTSLGILLLNDMTGDIVDNLGPENFTDLNGELPCCDIVYDARRDRAIFTRVTTNEILVFEIAR